MAHPIALNCHVESMPSSAQHPAGLLTSLYPANRSSATARLSAHRMLRLPNLSGGQRCAEVGQMPAQREYLQGCHNGKGCQMN